MGQSKAQEWIHGLLAVRRAMLRALGDTPARSVTALGNRCGVAEAEVATMVERTEGSPPPSNLSTASTGSLLATMGPNGISGTSGRAV